MRDKLEYFFTQLARIITNHAALVIGAMMILTLLFSLPLTQMSTDSTIQYYLNKDDPHLIAYEQFRDIFGSDQRLIIGIQSSNIFALPFLERLRTLHRSIDSNVPYINKIESLLTTPLLMERAESMTVTSLLESWPSTPVEFSSSLNHIRSVPLYRNLFYTDDESFAIIVLSIDDNLTHTEEPSDEDILAQFDENVAETAFEQKQGAAPNSLNKNQVHQMVEAVYAVVLGHQHEDFQIYPTGLPIYRHFVRQMILKDTLRFILLSTVAIAFVLFILLRRLSGVILPLIVVFGAIASTMGLMAFWGKPIKTPTTILPSFLMAVGVGACVHVMTLFFRYLKMGYSRGEAISRTLEHSGLAITITSLTTAAGLFSFSIADIAPVADLGLFAGIGVVLSFVYAIVLLPALLTVIPLQAKYVKDPTEIKPPILDKVLDGFARFSLSHATAILISCGLILSIALMGITKIKFSHNPLRWFPKSTPIRHDTEIIDKHLKGLINVEILIDCQELDGFKSLENLQRLEKLQSSLKNLSTREISIGKTTSLVDMIKRTHWSLNKNSIQFYQIPDDPKMLAQELLLIETSSPDLLYRWVDNSYRTGRVTLHAPWVDAVSYGRFIEKIETRCKEIFGASGTITVTGNIPILARTLNATMESMVNSYLLAGMAITLMMILLIGDLKIGCLSMLPNLLPIFIALGIIGWIGIPLDMYTMLVGSIALGLAVDDTVHFMYHFRRYYDRTKDVKQAVHMTLHTAGRAMLITSMVMTTGAFIFTFATVKSLQNFGLITGVTIILALLSDFLLAPAIMTLVYGRTEKDRIH